MTAMAAVQTQARALEDLWIQVTAIVDDFLASLPGS